jgi:hypothetical protein
VILVNPLGDRESPPTAVAALRLRARRPAEIIWMEVDQVYPKRPESVGNPARLILRRVMEGATMKEEGH